MNTMIIIAMTLLFAYTLIICVVNRGIPSSLSDSVFALPPSGAWLWTVIIFAVAAMTLPVILQATPENWKFLAFLAIVGLLFVALCPLIKDKGDMTYKAHMAGALTCAVCSQILLAVSNAWLLLTWIPWIIAYVLISRKRKWESSMFWAEMVCFTDTFIFCLHNQ